MDLDILTAHWTDFKGSVALAFPHISNVDLTRNPVGSDGFVVELASAHDLTWSETREMLSDLILHGLASGLAQTNEVTHKIVASS